MNTTSAVGAPESGDPGESVPAAAYRPHLDGLRAVAVYLVVLFHAGSDRFAGGYIGVDVFFVLSGFLVTQLLLRDVVGRGSIRFGRFYSRRFRRLLPAAFVALIVTASTYTALVSPAEALNTIGSFKAAFLYSTNWYFIYESTGYFGADLTANPVLHFWSLAVEEQFYLLWPLALGGVFALTHRMDRVRQMRAIRTAVAVAAVASAAWALSLRTTNPNWAYYGTDTRAYELLAGASVALAPAFLTTAARFRRSMWVAAVMSLLAIVMLGLSTFQLGAIERGIAVTIATCVLIAALEAAEGGVVKRALSTPSMTYLGKISYGTYLWHWLVIIVVLTAFHLSIMATVGIAVLVATALASLSFEVMEHPVRISTRLDRHRGTVIATGLAVSVASALVLIPAIVDPSRASVPIATSSTTAGFSPIPASVDWRHARQGGAPMTNCLGKPVDACTVVHGTGRHILLIGDSHAAMYVPTFTAIARQENLTLSVAVKGGCPWQLGLFAPAIPVFGRMIRPEDCEAERDDLYTRVIPALHPDVIVASNYGYEYSNQYMPYEDSSGRALQISSPADRELIETATTRSLAALRADGRRVVLVEPIPRAPVDPIACLSKAKVLEECRHTAKVAPDRLELFYRKLAQQDDKVSAADFDRLVCPFLPICDPVVNGQIVMQDPAHLSPKFAQSIAPAVADYLKQTGVIPR